VKIWIKDQGARMRQWLALVRKAMCEKLPDTLRNMQLSFRKFRGVYLLGYELKGNSSSFKD